MIRRSAIAPAAGDLLCPTLLILASLLAAPVAPAAALAVYGSIRGTISDSSGAVLPGVTVTVTSKERNTSDTLVTDSGRSKYAYDEEETA